MHPNGITYDKIWTLLYGIWDLVTDHLHNLLHHFEIIRSLWLPLHYSNYLIFTIGHKPLQISALR